MRSSLYALSAAGLALLTALVFVLHGSGSYMFVLYGGILAVILAGVAYDKHRAASEPVTADLR